ncbi:hypothetical protein BD779DRAFT_1759258 [Infundibulicybe gibba]|nr:hypothetical protein BD779DRAFT_1759258 [Infundibulicybe gibba]
MKRRGVQGTSVHVNGIDKGDCKHDEIWHSRRPPVRGSARANPIGVTRCRSIREIPLLKDMARSSLSKLFIQGQIPVSEHNLGEVLCLMFPPIPTTPSERSQFVLGLIAVLWGSTKPDTTSWSVRHLELLLTKCSYAVTEAFMNNNGFGAVLRAAKAGDLDSGRLQVDCLRTLVYLFKV